MSPEIRKLHRDASRVLREGGHDHAEAQVVYDHLKARWEGLQHRHSHVAQREWSKTWEALTVEQRRLAEDVDREVRGTTSTFRLWPDHIA